MSAQAVFTCDRCGNEKRSGPKDRYANWEPIDWARVTIAVYPETTSGNTSVLHWCGSCRRSLAQLAGKAAQAVSS